MTARRNLAIVAGLVAVAAMVATVRTGLEFGGADRVAPRSPPQQTLEVHYTGVFKYSDQRRPAWKTSETIEVRRAVLRRAAEFLPLASPRPTSSPPFAARPGPYPLRGVDALGPTWHFAGTKGLSRRIYLFVRKENLPVRLPPHGTVSVVNDIGLPVIHLGRTRLVPDGESTMRLQGPKRLIKATSPPGVGERFAGEVSFTISLRGLATTETNPRVAIRDPEPPRKSVPAKVVDAAGDTLGWLWGRIVWVLGLAVAAAVTIVVDRILKRRGVEEAGSSESSEPHHGGPQVILDAAATDNEVTPSP